MNNIKVYKCFIASPSDTNKEREVCDEIFKEINETIGEHHKFRVESLKWENDANPSIGNGSQDVINKQLLSACNIFIGIMYRRFGTPTNNYNSGTEEEFLQACSMYEKNPDSIEIKMYFNNAPICINKIDTKQVEQVNAFKKLVTEQGVLYAEYNGVEEFKEKLKKNLTQYLLKTLNIKDTKRNPIQDKSIVLVKNKLSQRFNDSLFNFKDKNIAWVDRELCKTKELSSSKKSEDVDKFEIATLIDKPSSKMIYAQPLSGLTCLSHYLIQKAWEKGSVWVYLDAARLTTNNYEQSIEKECRFLEVNISDIQGIVLDSWSKSGLGMLKLLKLLRTKFQEIPIIIMTSEACNLSQEKKIQKPFHYYTLMDLTQNKIRKFIKNSNSVFQADDNKVLKKIVNDLHTLNIHRTPENCLILLKIAEHNFNEHPVNRTKMVGMILTLLFDFNKSPTYSRKPDVEHCEFLLGYFCENLIRNSKGSFTQNEFIYSASEFLKENKIDLDIYNVFKTLSDNRIIIEDESICKFRHVYWIYYFAAKRMHQKPDFYNFIINDKKYISYIEVIDFYTGITRNENDLIDVLTKEIKQSCDRSELDLGLDGDFNPLEEMKFVQTEQDLQNTHSRIKNEVLNSNLPDAVKDEYADKGYDFNRPNNQSLPEIYEHYSLTSLFKIISVCSRALRNSEFIEPKKKPLLLTEIFRSWHLLSKLLFVLAPILAKQNKIIIDGWGVSLEGFTEKSTVEKIKSILVANPTNIVNWMRDDLYSERLLPLLEEKFNNDENVLVRHLLIIFIINSNPKGWKHIVQSYIESIGKDSVYINNVESELLNSHQYDFLTKEQLVDRKELIEMIYVKKTTKSKHLIDTAKSIKNQTRLSRI